MSILAFATGPSSVLYGSLTVTGETDATHISPYGKQAFNTYGTAGINGNLNISFTEQSSFWFSCYAYIGNFAVSSGGVFLKVQSGTIGSSVSTLLGLSFDTSTKKILLQTYNGATYSTVASSSITFTTSSRYRLDLQVTLSDTVGIFRLYVNRILVAEFTGDTLTNAIGTASIINFPMNYPAGAEVHSVYWSTCFVANEDTRTITMIEHSISGAGGYAEMQGGYTAINELGPIDDTDYLFGQVDGQCNTFTKSALPSEFSTGYEIKAQGVYARAITTDLSLVKKERFAIYDGTNLSESVSNTIDTFYNTKQAIFALAPDGGAWTFAKADATQVGVKVKES